MHALKRAPTSSQCPKRALIIISAYKKTDDNLWTLCNLPVNFALTVLVICCYYVFVLTKWKFVLKRNKQANITKILPKESLLFVIARVSHYGGRGSTTKPTPSEGKLKESPRRPGCRP